MEGLPEFNKVAYVIIGNLCYFAGIERENRTSTINAAEYVIFAVSFQEKVSASSLRFFDIQCRGGYERYFPGQYEVNEVIFEVDTYGEHLSVKLIGFGGEDAFFNTSVNDFISVDRWEKAVCDEKILELFRKYIGADLKLHEKYGTLAKFSEDLLAVIDEKNLAYHLKEDGTPAYEVRHLDVTDFHGGKAWVLGRHNHLWAQIDKHGNVVSEWFKRDQAFVG